MKHRWADDRKRRWGDHVRPWPGVSKYIGRTCTQCGARHLRTGIVGREYYRLRQWIAPIGSPWQLIKHIPPCEGLPANYDAPIGA